MPARPHPCGARAASMGGAGLVLVVGLTAAPITPSMALNIIIYYIRGRGDDLQ